MRFLFLFKGFYFPRSLIFVFDNILLTALHLRLKSFISVHLMKLLYGETCHVSEVENPNDFDFIVLKTSSAPANNYPSMHCSILSERDHLFYVLQPLKADNRVNLSEN